MEIVINKCYGGFGLSAKAMKRYGELEGTAKSDYDMERTDPLLIQVVKELGEEANANYAKLAVIEIPDDVDWELFDYDGIEMVVDKNRTWG